MDNYNDFVHDYIRRRYFRCVRQCHSSALDWCVAIRHRLFHPFSNAIRICCQQKILHRGQVMNIQYAFLSTVSLFSKHNISSLVVCRLDTTKWCILWQYSCGFSASTCRKEEYVDDGFTVGNHRLDTDCHSHTIRSGYFRPIHYRLLCGIVSAICSSLCK